MSPTCADNIKYEIIEKIVDIIKSKYENKVNFAGQEIKGILTINGVRFTLNDGSWGLIRASSNTPNLVVVCECPTSENVMKEIFYSIDNLLITFKEIGSYDQTI